MDRIDAIIIGAGVIGLAIARELAMAGRSVLILEAEPRFGTGITARCSEVIHAGLHYRHGSLKERLCIAGKSLLYAYCASRHVPHKRLGKLTFAGSKAELPRLEAIFTHAQEAGADPQLQWFDGAQAAAVEPAIACAAAIHSPSSGIIDAQALMLSLLGEAENHGATLATHAPADRIERTAQGWRVHSGKTRIDADLVVNAAGLGAQELARATDGLEARHIPARYLAKATYFTYSGRVPFTHLIYPLPEQGGLGTHLTLDMGGQARFGPDVEWVDAIDYTVDPARHGEYLAAARRFWLGIDPERLAPGYAGIRPKIAGPGDPDADFVLQGPQVHGLPGLINLFGIESPGLTSSLAIAREVTALCVQGT